MVFHAPEHKDSFNHHTFDRLHANYELLFQKSVLEAVVDVTIASYFVGL